MGLHIYVFDEATSNVDAESENDIMKAIHSLCKDYALYLRHHPYVPAWDTNLYAR